MFRKLTKTFIILTGILAILVVTLFAAMSVANSPLYAWRVITNFQSDTGDIDLFPERPIATGETVSALPVEPSAIPEEESSGSFAAVSQPQNSPDLPLLGRASALKL